MADLREWNRFLKRNPETRVFLRYTVAILAVSTVGGALAALVNPTVQVRNV